MFCDCISTCTDFWWRYSRTCDSASRSPIPGGNFFIRLNSMCGYRDGLNFIIKICSLCFSIISKAQSRWSVAATLEILRQAVLIWLVRSADRPCLMIATPDHAIQPTAGETSRVGKPITVCDRAARNPNIKFRMLTSHSSAVQRYSHFRLKWLRCEAVSIRCDAPYGESSLVRTR